MVYALVLLHYLHELLVHLPLLFILLRSDFPDVLVLFSSQLLFG